MQFSHAQLNALPESQSLENSAKSGAYQFLAQIPKNKYFNLERSDCIQRVTRLRNPLRTQKVGGFCDRNKRHVSRTGRNCDEARTLHFPDFNVLAGAACCDPPGQRGRTPAPLLSPSRRPSLRHGHANGRQDGRIRIGKTRVHRSVDLPILSRLHRCAHHAD